MKRGLFHDGVPVLTPWQMAIGTALHRMAGLIARSCCATSAFLRKHWLPLLGTGVLGQRHSGLPLRHGPNAASTVRSRGMLNSLTPLFTLLAGVLLLRTPGARGVQLIGILLGLVGAVGLIALDSGRRTPVLVRIYAMLPVLGTICYGLSGNIVKQHLYSLPAHRHSGPWRSPSWGRSAHRLLVSGPAGDLGHAPARLVGTGLCGRAGGDELGRSPWCFGTCLLQRTTAVRASSVTYLMPVVAIGWGLLDGESISWPASWA